jgi:hypothetical protein
MTNKLELLKQYVDIQANDDGVWIIPKTASEDYILQEFRRLVYLIEEASEDEIEEEIEVYRGRLGIV